MSSKHIHEICYKCLKGFSSSEDQHHGLHHHCFQEWFRIPTSLEFADLARKQQDEESQNPNIDSIEKINSSFFQGKFKKYSATLNAKNYILKVQEPEYPELPATEFLCNQIAKLLKIKIPDFYFIRLQNSKDTFVVKNFMQEVQAGNLIHISFS